MNQDERSLRRAVEKPEDTESGIQSELSTLSGRPTRHQKEIIDGLVRLHHSLRGPEQLLDRRSYSRPFPPAHHQYRWEDEREYRGGEIGQSDGGSA